MRPRPKHLRLVSVDGVQIAPAPSRGKRGAALRNERAVRLMIIKEHLGHITHSVERLKAIASELEASLGLALPEIAIDPRPDIPGGSSDLSA